MPESPSIAAPPKIKTEPIKEFRVPTGVLAMDATPDGGKIYAACLNGDILEIDSESGEKTVIGLHDSYASGVRLLPGGGGLVSSGYDGRLQWHDIASRKTVRQVDAHRFWSWQLASSPDGAMVASVTGQYLCGGLKYEPAPETEPSVKVFDAKSGGLLRSFGHVPPVLSAVFSPDSRYLAAGNLMGEVRVWDLATGEKAGGFSTPSFTGWGVIKGHYYTGGIFAMNFGADSSELWVAGMGSTTDPAAGNGKQLWQRFAWREGKKLDESHEGEHGAGLMETLAFHPGHAVFAMAGRLFQGKWNTAFFDAKTGSLLHSLDAKFRVTIAVFAAKGEKIILAGAAGQERKKEGKFPDFGRIAIHKVVLS